MTFQEIVREIPSLTMAERKQLMMILIDTSKDTGNSQVTLLDLEGLGAEIWEGIDAQEYVNALRDEWVRII